MQKRNVKNTHAIASIVLVLSLLFSMTACAKPEPAISGETSPEEQTQPVESVETQPVESTETQPAETEETLPEEKRRANEILRSMSLTEKIYQMFIVAPEQLTGEAVVTEAGEAIQQALAEMPVGGIICFASNIETPEQITGFISDLQNDSKYKLFIAVDEEGGTVARIARNDNMGTTVFPNMKYIGDTGDPAEAYNVGWTIGNDIKKFGFNVDFAPVADVNSNPDNPVIGERAFGTTPDVVSEMVAAAVQGFVDSGVGCSLKHFPGHGDTAMDSHDGYTEISKTLEELREVEFPPFAAGIRASADFVMVGHISVPNVTGDGTPATLSKTMLDILKKGLGFQGLVITDAMQMEAIQQSYSPAEAALMAIHAGIDVILMPADLREAASGIYEAVISGELSEQRIDESVLKIIETKLRLGILEA